MILNRVLEIVYVHVEYSRSMKIEIKKFMTEADFPPEIQRKDKHQVLRVCISLDVCTSPRPYKYVPKQKAMQHGRYRVSISYVIFFFLFECFAPTNVTLLRFN